jgi:stearoyl-CoA desaturase (delta-9 desaturase)
VTADSQSPVHPAQSVAGKVITLVAVTVPLAGVVIAITQMWQREIVPVDLWMMGVLYLLTGLGITVGYHRFATHKSFRTNPVVEFVLLAFGSMAVEGSVIGWTATHWKHHRLADKPGDPHSPVEGLFHAHIGWMFDSDRQGDPRRDARHLLADPVARWADRTMLLWLALGFIVPFMIDGWRGLIWGGLVRVFLTHHVTWSVNSVCHQFGRRTFDTPDVSKNQWIVGVFGLGEGWHNNHHAFPESAFHGLRWYQIDVAGYFIRGLERLHLAKDVRRVSRERIELRKNRETPARQKAKTAA